MTECGKVENIGACSFTKLMISEMKQFWMTRKAALQGGNCHSVSGEPKRWEEQETFSKYLLCFKHSERWRIDKHK